MLALLIEGTATETASCGTMYVPTFMKTGKGVQAILRFCPRNFRGCNVGIIDRIYELRC
jgi:hypothetical protein